MPSTWRECLCLAVCALLLAVAEQARAQPVEAVWSLAQKEQAAFLTTLKTLVEIESGSADIEGLDRIAGVIAGRFTQLGAKVELIDPGPEVYKMFDTPGNGRSSAKVPSPLLRRTRGGPSVAPKITSRSPSVSTSAAHAPE